MRYADSPTTEAVVHVDAPPATVWALVTDLDVHAEASGELQAASWRGDVSGPAVGDTFTGRNAHPAVGEWETVSTVIECDAPRSFAWAVMDPEHPAATWRFTLAPSGDGTELRQWARLGPGPSNLTTVIARMPDKEERIVAGRLREWQAAMEATLTLIKDRAER